MTPHDSTHLSDFDFLSRTFELAYFLHPRTKLARKITLEALARVEVVAGAQDKRRYYRLASRRSGRYRSRVSMTKPQLLQRLVYSLSEPYERRQEADHDFDEDDMTVRFIVYLARICLRRNAFHVALGLGRLLHAYTTNETMALYGLVVQDPNRFHEPDYFRARKKRLFEELCQRFEPWVRPRRGPRGERHFEPRPADLRLEELVRRTLALVTPWETSCVIPECLRPAEEELEALRFRGPQPDDEHPVEMRRIHALLHPDCFARLTAALEMAPPAERLTMPLLSMVKDTGNGDGKADRDRLRPPRLDEGDRHAILGELKRREGLRRRLSAGSLRIRVDSTKAVCWNAEHESRVRIELHEGAELVEVVGRESGEDVVLAVYLLPCFEDGRAEEARASMRWRPAWRKLAGGGWINFTPLAEPDGFAVDIGYQEASLRRAGRLLRRWVPPLPNSRRLAAGFAFLVLAAAGTVVLLDRPEPFTPPPTRGHPIEVTERRRIFIDTFGESSPRQELRGELAEHLASHGFRVVDELAEAEVVLGLADTPSGAALSLTAVLRRRGVQGEVLWQGTLQGSAEDAARQIADAMSLRPTAGD